MASEAPKEPLTPLMQLAVPGGPRALAGAQPGAALALALHAMLVEGGLSVVMPSGVPPARSRFAPPPSWHVAFPDEWVFAYTLPGKANPLHLHCSLQAATGRLFVNGTESNNLSNNQVLGLQLSNYVDAARMGRSSWEGVVARQAALRSMFTEHVLRPLVEGAVDLPEDHGTLAPLRAASAQLGEWLLLPNRRTALAVLLPTVAAVAVVAVVARRRGAGLRR